MNLDYETAKANFLALNFQGCKEFFTENNHILELGYYEILSENLNEAKKLFKKISDEDIRANWALFLISMIEECVNSNPSYFELRNFLEIDLNILIQNAKGSYVHNILKYIDYMYTVNPEVYKFCARVFYNNDLREEGFYLLLRAKDSFYTDPELHYLLACAYMDKGDKMQALHYVKTCQEVLPQYYPAVKLEKQLLSIA